MEWRFSRPQKWYPEGPRTHYSKILVPKPIRRMVFGTRVLKYWVLGPSGALWYTRVARSTRQADIHQATKSCSSASVAALPHQSPLQPPPGSATSGARYLIYDVQVLGPFGLCLSGNHPQYCLNKQRHAPNSMAPTLELHFRSCNFLRLRHPC